MPHNMEKRLDDIIKYNQKQKRKISGENRRSERAGAVFKATLHQADYKVKKSSQPKSMKRKPKSSSHNAERHRMNRTRKTERFALKLLVTNLNYGISDSDVRKLFSKLGPMKKVKMHYDRFGRSIGTAEVVVKHDQRSGPSQPKRKGQVNGSFRAAGGGGKQRQGPGKRNQPPQAVVATRANKKPIISAEALDAELEAYMSERHKIEEN